MRFGVVVGVALLAACGSLASTTWANGTSPVCGPSSTRTLASDRSARVYASAGNVYGCAAGGSTSYLLGSRSNCGLAPGPGYVPLQYQKVGPLRVAGRVAAYELDTCATDCYWAAMNIRRLTDDKLLRVHDLGGGCLGSYTDVGSLALKADGAAAWIVTSHPLQTSCRDGACGPTPGFGIRQVVRLDKRGFKVLDSGGRIIGARSLTLRGSTISWRHGNAIRTATLH